MGDLPDQTDEFFEKLVPLLKEDTAFPNEGPSPQGQQDILSRLLDENARLRALAVTLSNLLGDLPVPEWEHAMAVAPTPLPACQPHGAAPATDQSPAVHPDEQVGS